MENIKINKKEKNGIIILEFTNGIDETNTDDVFTYIYEKIGDFNGTKVILNLSGLNHINSKSIGYIIDLFSNIDENGGKMYISNCSEGLKDIFKITGVEEILLITDTEEEALKAINE